MKIDSIKFAKVWICIPKVLLMLETDVHSLGLYNLDTAEGPRGEHPCRLPHGKGIVAQWDCSCLPSGPKAQPGLGSDVPPDQLAFPSCDGEGKVRMSDYYFINCK